MSHWNEDKDMIEALEFDDLEQRVSNCEHLLRKLIGEKSARADSVASEQHTTLLQKEINLNSDLELSWPIPLQIDVISNNDGYTLRMPNATETSIGQSVLINNPTAYSFNLLKNDWSLLTAIGPSTINYFYLIDNTTVGGTWKKIPLTTKGETK